MDVSYEQLNGGYVLQLKDRLVLHGLVYEVEACSSDGNYLSYTKGMNSSIFDILGMGAEERKNFVKKFNPVRFGDAQGALFPEFSDLKTLTDLVIALYEVPEYKEGDWVTVLPRDESNDYHPVCYTNAMREYVGRTFQVQGHRTRSETQKCNEVDNGDPHTYTLCEAGYHWTTQMIRKATEEEIRDAKGEVKDSDRPTSLKPVISAADFLSKEKAKELSSEVDALLKFCKPKGPSTLLNGYSVLPVYAPLCKDTPSDTEIRLPKDEDSTPHIKL